MFLWVSIDTTCAVISWKRRGFEERSPRVHGGGRAARAVLSSSLLSKTMRHVHQFDLFIFPFNVSSFPSSECVLSILCSARGAPFLCCSCHYLPRPLSFVSPCSLPSFLEDEIDHARSPSNGCCIFIEFGVCGAFGLLQRVVATGWTSCLYQGRDTGAVSVRRKSGSR